MAAILRYRKFIKALVFVIIPVSMFLFGIGFGLAYAAHRAMTNTRLTLAVATDTREAKQVVSRGEARGQDAPGWDAPGAYEVIVAPGDTLWDIANRYYPDVDARKVVWALKVANGLEDGGVLVPGTRIRLAGGEVSMDYNEFLDGKRFIIPPAGFAVKEDVIHPKLFPFQRDITKWALQKGRAAIFADCGLGKTLMQLEWANHISRYSDANVLILAPLAVANQTAKEGQKIGLEVSVCRSMDDVKPGVNITNYEILHKFNAEEFAGIVLDESSILKAYDGKTRTQIIESFNRTPFRLACTATPAPNDFMELGNHSEFLGVMNRTEMLATFFVHDGGDTSKWRLKGHAEERFWEWVASWAVVMRRPSDLGYEDGDFILPPLDITEHIVATGKPIDGQLFAVEARTLEERRKARQGSVRERVSECAKLVNETDGPFLVWCDLNRESELLTKSISGAVEVKGSDSPEHKEQAMTDFSAGKIRVLVTKPSIAGFGMNWQHCNNMAFVGLSDSYEAFYQAVRRCWRFGQTKSVDTYMIISDQEGAVVANIKRKEADTIRLQESLVKYTQEITKQNIRATVKDVETYQKEVAKGDGWTMYLGDCVEIIREIPDNSIHYSIFSPPFASLYTYSNSERDMGNSKNDAQFYAHFGFLVEQLFRVLLHGRLISIHCMDIPMMKQRDGQIGLKDFPAEIRRICENAGFIYHSKVTIWKDPVVEMQRTKSLGLLHKQLKKDSCMSRQGIPDYLVVMRKPGDNPERVTHTNESFPVDLWQKYASPVWMDINPSNTLQRESAREHKDERHICPLQLGVIERALQLWTNHGDLVLSPFAGIGSEGYESLRLGRRFIGVELKRSYWEQARRNLEAAATSRNQPRLFEVPIENDEVI